jgi:hypothetical protein
MHHCVDRLCAPWWLLKWLAWIVLCTICIGAAHGATKGADNRYTPSVDSALQISLTVDRNNALPNEQFLVTQVIEHAPEVFNITTQDPEITAGELLSVDFSEQHQDNGRVQQVKRWALFLQRGSTRIGPARVQATLPVADGPNQTLSVQTDILSLTVDSTGDTAKDAAPVPAAAVSVDTTGWAGPETSWRTGDPVRLQLKISTEGQRAAALPPPRLPESKSFRFYPEPATLVDSLTPRGIVRNG